MERIGKTLTLIGIALTLVGALVWWLGPKLGTSGVLLPGDISFKRGNVSFYFPLVTCLILSVLLTLLFRLFNR